MPRFSFRYPFLLPLILLFFHHFLQFLNILAWGNDDVNNLAATLKSLNAYNLEYIWDGTKVRPYGRAGIDVEFKVSKAVSIMLEGNANILSDKYNSKKADNPDW